MKRVTKNGRKCPSINAADKTGHNGFAFVSLMGSGLTTDDVIQSQNVRKKNACKITGFSYSLANEVACFKM